MLFDFILEEVQVSERKDLEEFVEGISTDFVVINVDIIEVRLVFQNINKGRSSLIVNVVIRQLQLFQRMTFSDKITNDFAILLEQGKAYHFAKKW